MAWKDQQCEFDASRASSLVYLNVGEDLRRSWSVRLVAPITVKDCSPEYPIWNFAGLLPIARNMQLRSPGKLVRVKPASIATDVEIETLMTGVPRALTHLPGFPTPDRFQA